MPDTFPVVILIGRPAAGKSEIIDYLRKMSADDRQSILHIAPFDEIDDFVWLWQLFEDDDIRDNLGRERLNTTRDYYFKDPFLWNFLIEKINRAFEKKLAEDPGYLNDHTIVIEFARGGEKAFGDAFVQLSDGILQRASILYIDVSYEESLRRNRRRARKGQEGSILHHSLPDEKMETYYRTNDWVTLSRGQAQGVVEIRGYHIPFAVFQNEPEKTGDPARLRPALEQALGNLWKMRLNSNPPSPNRSGG